MLLRRHVVEQGVSRVANVIIIVADESKSVTVARRNAG